MHLSPRFLPLVLVPMLSLLAPGCGHSEEEWQQQLAKYDKLDGEFKSKQKELEDAQAKVADLEKRLRGMGVDIESRDKKLAGLNASLEEQARALAEYKARAHQLELIKARFEALRRKLDELTRLGLAVNIRHNRMVISLPGDVLFDSGKDTLKKDGQAILQKVAAVVNADDQLKEARLPGRRPHRQQGPERRRLPRQLGPLPHARPRGPPLPRRREGRRAAHPALERRRLRRHRPRRRQQQLPTMAARRTAAATSSSSPSVEEMLDLKAITQ